MKKITVLFIGLLISILLFGCKNDTNLKNENSNAETTKKYQDIELVYGDYYSFDNVKSIVSSDIKKVRNISNRILALDITDKPIEVKVTDFENKVSLYRVTVKKAKLNIVIVAGQSNASGATAGVPASADKYTLANCKAGTAYLWKGLSGAPIFLSGGGIEGGFSVALAAEWYEQSLENGNPEKTVVVFEQNCTATPGEKLDEWINGNTEKASLHKTAQALNACYEYYENGAGSRIFEIANCGMYWLQGEAERRETADYYYNRFVSLWDNLKNQTKNKIKYCAFMRVRGDEKNESTLSFSGPVMAQYKLANDFDDIYMASSITRCFDSANYSDLVSVDVSNYHIFNEWQYGEIISNNKITEKVRHFYGGLHYSRLGYNIIGADAAYNMYNSLYKNNREVTLENSDGRILSTAHIGQTVELSKSNISKSIYIYVATGSKGNLKFKVTDGSKDVTDSVLNKGNSFDGYAINGEKIKALSAPKITVSLLNETMFFVFK